jgi:hypothetical protein
MSSVPQLKPHPSLSRAEFTAVVQRPHASYQVRPFSLQGPLLAAYTDLRDTCSFTLHATARQLHDWTRREKQKLKEQRAERAKAYAEKETGSNCSEKPPSTEAEDDETLDGEMDNFQTPQVRRDDLSLLYVDNGTRTLRVFSSAASFLWYAFSFSWAVSPLIPGEVLLTLCFIS